MTDEAMTEERSVWSGSPSQVVNFGTYVFCGLFFWLAFPLLVMFWQWLAVKNTKYELTTQRLRMRSGILNKQTDELELYRVRDFEVREPLFLRLFSKANIVLCGSDRTHPEVVLRAVPNAEEIREQIRKYVEECRTRKKVREVDFE
jgi:uncharacterized membrane protein YdbT with pleckstrin-like domain